MIRKSAFAALALFAVVIASAYLPAESSGVGVGLRTGSPEDAAIAAHAGGQWAAIHSSWAAVEPAQGLYSEKEIVRLAQWSTALKASGRKVLLTMSGAPDWATGRPKDVKGSWAPRPETAPLYGTMLAMLAGRLGTSVDAWTTWNEPNLPMFMDPPSPEIYAALQRAGFGAIKSVRPRAVVLAGPFAARTATDLRITLGPYMRLGLGRHADALAWNSYQPAAPWRKAWHLAPGATVTWAENLQTALRWVSTTRPGWAVWLTEFGSSTCSTASAFRPAWCVTPAQQAINLAAAYRIIRRHTPGLRTAFWYTARDSRPATEWVNALGLVTADGAHKPALDAFRTVAAESAIGKPTIMPAVARSSRVRAVRIAVAPEGMLRLRFSTVGSTPGQVVVSGQILNAWQRISTSKVAGPASVVAAFVDKGYARLRITVVR